MGDRGNHAKRPANPTPQPTREQRRIEGDTRNAAWRALGPVKQLAHLNALGLTAKRQRSKLARVAA